MIKIGDFSKLSLVSIKTLRYYDEMGLLKPVHVDQFSGYRYYSVEQLPRLHRILALKDLGFSLEQIAHVLNEGVTPEQLRGMLRLRQAELQQHISDEQERLARIEARLSIMTMEGSLFQLPTQDDASSFLRVPAWLFPTSPLSGAQISRVKLILQSNPHLRYEDRRNCPLWHEAWYYQIIGGFLIYY